MRENEVKLELNLKGNPTGRSAFQLNCDLGKFINRILGRNVQEHGLNMSYYRVGKKYVGKKYVWCIEPLFNLYRTICRF